MTNATTLERALAVLSVNFCNDSEIHKDDDEAGKFYLHKVHVLSKHHLTLIISARCYRSSSFFLRIVCDIQLDLNL